MPHVIIKKYVDEIKEEWLQKKLTKSIVSGLKSAGFSDLAEEFDRQQKAVSVKSLARKYGYPINTVRYGYE